MLAVSVAVCNPDLIIFRNFIQSLKKFTPEMAQLLIYDNASESKEFINIANQYFAPELSDHKVKVKITHSNSNIGFGAAHNRNLSHANAKYFAVLNDDIEFFENWATPMIQILEENPKVAQVGPKKKVFNTLGVDNIGGWEDTDSPEYCEGSCFIMPTSLAKGYRLFDEEYQYGYFEDMDLSLRFKKDGYLLRNADIQWEHHKGTTTVKMIMNNFDLPGYYIVNEYLFKKKWHSYLMKKRFGEMIVIKREAETGDVFLIMPVIEALKEKYPDCVIILMTQCSDAVKGCFDIDGFVPYGSSVPCDIFIDLDYAFEKDFRKHIVDCYAEVAGVKARSKTASLYTEKKDMEYTNSLVQEYPLSVTLDFSDSISGKQWKREKYVELGKLVKQEGLSLITVGKTAQQYASYLDADLNLVNVLTPLQTALVIAKSKLFIGNEDLLALFAQSTHTPSIVLYGCTLPEYVSDTSLPMLIPVVTPVACRGCRHRHNTGRIIACPRNFACMEAITVDMVYEKFREVMKNLRINE
ncbi:MAG: glycosyltransferase [Nitrospira sp.]|nr:glycosyltransferase [Nitrospira sp.]